MVLLYIGHKVSLPPHVCTHCLTQQLVNEPTKVIFAQQSTGIPQPVQKSLHSSLSIFQQVKGTVRKTYEGSNDRYSNTFLKELSNANDIRVKSLTQIKGIPKCFGAGFSFSIL